MLSLILIYLYLFIYSFLLEEGMLLSIMIQ